MAADEVLRFMIRWFARHDTPPTVRQVWKAATKAAEARFTSTNKASAPCPQCVDFGAIPPLVNYCKTCGRKLHEHGARC